jgi:hypothetical protein
MKAFLKKWWWLLLGLAVAAIIVWRLWPKTAGVKRKIDFIDLPIITGGDSITNADDDERDVGDTSAGHNRMLDLIDESSRAIAAYDNG